MTSILIQAMKCRVPSPWKDHSVSFGVFQQHFSFTYVSWKTVLNFTALDNLKMVFIFAKNNIISNVANKIIEWKHIELQCLLCRNKGQYTMSQFQLSYVYLNILFLWTCKIKVIWTLAIKNTGIFGHNVQEREARFNHILNLVAIKYEGGWKWYWHNLNHYTFSGKGSIKTKIKCWNFPTQGGGESSKK